MNRPRSVIATIGVLAVNGCTRPAPTTQAMPAAPAASTPSAVARVVSPPTPTTAAPSSAQTDVLDALRSFAAAQCSWSWRNTRTQYLAALTAWTTPGYAVTVQAQSSAVRWRDEVLKQRQVVTCRITDARLADGAPPPTGVVAYTRVSTVTHVDSSVGSFDTGLLQRSWRLELTAGRWLVAGPFSAG